MHCPKELLGSSMTADAICRGAALRDSWHSLAACLWIICWLKVPQDFNSGLLKWTLKTKKLCNMRVAQKFDLPLIYTPWTGGRLMTSIGVIGGNPYKLFWNPRLLHMPLQPTWRNLNISKYYDIIICTILLLPFSRAVIFLFNHAMT